MIIDQSLRADFVELPFPSDEQAAINVKQGTVVNAFLSENARLTASVWNIDRNMFEYYTSYNEYDKWIVNANEAIPNFRESQPIFSNIKMELAFLLVTTYLLQRLVLNSVKLN